MSERPLSHPTALAQYRRRAPIYDLELLPFEPIRRTAIERLALQPGEAVLDLGCGTGLSFEALEAAVGRRGTVIGVEQCPEMIAAARGRVRRHGWRNVSLVGAPAEAVAAGRRVDAALLLFTHDIVRAPAALDALSRRLRPGGRFVACGLQWAPLWAGPVNLFVLGAALHSVSSLEGLDRPWRGLADRFGRLDVQTTLSGAVYIASGTRAA